MTGLHDRLVEELTRLQGEGELHSVARIEMNVTTLEAFFSEAVSSAKTWRHLWHWRGNTDPLDPLGYTIAGIPLEVSAFLPDGIFVFGFETPNWTMRTYGAAA